MPKKRTEHRRVVRLSATDAAAPSATDTAAPPEPAPVVPRRAAGDTDAAWGDGPDDNDRRLRENVPPHW